MIQLTSDQIDLVFQALFIYCLLICVYFFSIFIRLKSNLQEDREKALSTSTPKNILKETSIGLVLSLVATAGITWFSASAVPYLRTQWPLELRVLTQAKYLVLLFAVTLSIGYFAIIKRTSFRLRPWVFVLIAVLLLAYLQIIIN
ncbi:MAG: hypothetical protein KC582_02805 [Candidatus Magasanikbacteria bacterium]|nr:hypothetical protein [Candidatus Magasanikbacteria bacterium]